MNIKPGATISQRLSQLAGRLSESSERWDRVDSGIAKSDGFVRAAEVDYDDAEAAQRIALHDTGEINSRPQGEQMKAAFNRAGRNVSQADSQVYTGRRELKGLSKELSQADADLDQILVEMEASADQRLALVRSASQDLNGSQELFQESGKHLSTFNLHTITLGTEVRMGSYHVWNIANDYKGKDVSGDAERVGDTLRKVDSEVQKMDGRLGDAMVAGLDGDQRLSASIASLLTASES